MINNKALEKKISFFFYIDEIIKYNYYRKKYNKKNKMKGKK